MEGKKMEHRDRIYLETMNEIFGADTKPVLIDGKLDNVLPVKTLGTKQ